MSDDTPSRASSPVAVGIEEVADRIVVIRGRRVLLDRDLAAVYGVAPKRLNEQVKRNQARFPDDFMFRLTLQEAQALLISRSQVATLKRGANVKYAPYAFTEHGAVMLASVLDSPVASPPAFRSSGRSCVFGRSSWRMTSSPRSWMPLSRSSISSSAWCSMRFAS
jgi:hypothetical protein